MPMVKLLGRAGLFWERVLRFIHCPFLLPYRGGKRLWTRREKAPHAVVQAILTQSLLNTPAGPKRNPGFLE